jgi:hypothetical protein
MTSREEMREAKKEAGLCLHAGCGSQAVMPPVINHCKEHFREDRRVRAARGPRKKRPPSN